MHHVHVSAVPEQEQRSPTGKFHSFPRNLSLTLGGQRNVSPWGGGHPFDVQIRRLPPGAAVCPFHSHLAQYELFYVLAGTGTVRVADGSHAIRAGDVFVHPPGKAHQLINSSDRDLEVFIVADNPPLDACYYPDSNKWGLRPPGVFFRLTEADYFDGEETPPPGTPPFQPPSRPLTAPVTPFAQRKLHIDDLAWKTWRSPKGKFGGASKELSIALGAKRDTPPGLGGHPFDLELGKLAPGQCGCPFHSHAAQWELFFFLSGTAAVRTPDGTREFDAGTLVLHPPGEAHQFTNVGNTDLLYLLVADNPPLDIWHYPDSNKWGHSSPRKFFRATDVDYHDGEE